MPHTRSALEAISNLVTSLDLNILNGGNYAFIRTLISDLDTTAREELKPFATATENLGRLLLAVDTIWGLNPTFDRSQARTFALAALQAIHHEFERQKKL